MRRWRKKTVITLLLATALVVAWTAVGWFAVPGMVVVPLRQVGYWWSGIASRTIAVEGDEWPYLECGDPGAPPVILLHGFATSKDAMMLLMPSVAAKGFRVLAPDLPGFGDHAFHAGARHDAAFYAAEIGSFMDAVGAPKAVLVGTSMGGAFASEVAIRTPERVSALALLGPAGVTPEVRTEFMKAVDAGANPMDIHDGESFDRVTTLVFWKQPWIPRPLRAWLVNRAVVNRTHTLEIVDALRPFLASGLVGRLGGVHAPTFVLYGEHDAVTDPSMARVFQREIPGATVVLVPDAGHVSYYDNWNGVWRELSAFLDRVPHG